jgi:transcriptional regulator CtsR
VGQYQSSYIISSFDSQIPAPSNLQLEKLSDVSYKLTWQDNSFGEQGFRIDRKTGDNPWVVGYGEVSENITSFTDDNVFIEKTTLPVNYRVYAFYMDSTSVSVTASTNAALTPPSDLTITPNTITYVTLNWQDNSTGEEGFKIERRYEGGNWEVIATITTNTYNDQNFALNTQVYYRVSAYVGQYQSSYIISSFDSQILAPANLQITQNTITSVTLNWQDNSTGEEGFRIERKQGTGNWDLITTLSGTSYTDETFELNTNVFYRIAAYYGDYYSDFAANSFNSQLPPPENLTITANSATSVTLNWSYNLTGHEGFRVERKIDNGNWEMLADNLNPNQTNFTDDGLDLPQHEYNYRVFAFLNGFQSNYVEGIAQYIPSIGENYKGGIVFYLDGNGGGLVCAETDQSSGQWGCYGTSISGTGTGIGTGAANTAAIVAGCSESGIAARICNNLVLNGYSDWFLPSKDELNLMYQNLKLAGIGGFADSGYWSSSENSSNNAWKQNFNNGNQNNLPR